MARKQNDSAENTRAVFGGNSQAGEQLRSIIERVERLEEEKAGLASDIKDVYAEARGNGFDVRAIKTIVKERKQDADERAEREAILDVYRSALGLI